VEPHPKVREDVEKEYLPKIAKLQSALEAKTIWANRLHENMNAVTVENRDLKMVRALYPTYFLLSGSREVGTKYFFSWSWT